MKEIKEALKSQLRNQWRSKNKQETPYQPGEKTKSTRQHIKDNNQK